MKEFGSFTNVRDYIAKLSERIGLLRMVNIKDGLQLQFKENKNGENPLPYKKFIIKAKYQGDDALIDTVKHYKNQAPALKNDVVKNAMDSIPCKECDMPFVLHGHDVTSIMALLIKHWGKKGLDLDKREQVELSFRLAYDFGCFKRTSLFDKLDKLANEQALDIWKY